MQENEIKELEELGYTEDMVRALEDELWSDWERLIEDPDHLAR